MSLYIPGAKGTGKFFCFVLSLMWSWWLGGWVPPEVDPPPSPIGVGQELCLEPKSGWVPFSFAPPPACLHFH